MKHDVRKLFEDRYESTFNLLKDHYERGPRGTYKIDLIQRTWEGFNACYEILEKEIAEEKAKSRKLVEAVEIYSDLHYAPKLGEALKEYRGQK